MAPNDTTDSEFEEAFAEAPASSAGSGAMSGMTMEESGSQPIPAITALAFCETAPVARVVKAISEDRRMHQARVALYKGGLQAAIGYLQQNPTPNLILIEATTTNQSMLDQVDELASHCDEGVQVMVVGVANDISLYRQLMDRGVSEYLVPPLDPSQVVRLIGRLFADPDTPFVGKSVAVIGSRGGVGSSTLAHNLAWVLAENIKINTALADLDLFFGTVSLAFNVENMQSIADALSSPERVDSTVIGRLMSRVTDRLSLLTALATITEAEDISAHACTTVINATRRVMPYVILDVPHVWAPWSAQLLLDSDEVILVCQPDLASLRNGKNLMDALKSQRPRDHPPRLLLNMVGVPKRPEIPVKDFASAIGTPPEGVIPFDPKLFGSASNSGQMISKTDPEAEASAIIETLAKSLTGREVVQEKPSLMQKIFRK